MGGALSAICVGCTSRKHGPANSFLSQAALAPGDQESVADAWAARLRSDLSDHRVPAGTLYAGQGLTRARNLVATFGGRLFVMSAGLGLVHDETAVPSYDLTIAKIPGAVTEKVQGAFSASAWWDAMMEGPYAASLASLLEGRGRIVIALSQSYAAMVGPWLATLPAVARGRLRLLGARLDRDLPASLVAQWIQYDSRLETAVPGMQLHYATRAMEHFLSVCGRMPMTHVAADQARVEAAMAGVVCPRPAVRPRMDDRDLAPMVAQAMARCGSMARALAYLRKVTGVACSDQRFRTLLREARA